MIFWFDLMQYATRDDTTYVITQFLTKHLFMNWNVFDPFPVYKELVTKSNIGNCDFRFCLSNTIKCNYVLRSVY